MTSAENPNSRELLRHYLAGESEAAEAIYRRYVERLVALARSRMSPRLRQRLDAEDVVQSAYCSFFVHARDEEYVLRRGGDLWRLLASITLHKLYGQAARHGAARRDLAREAPDDALLTHFATLEPTPAEAVALGEELHLATAALAENERAALIARLQGESIEAIAQQLGKSPRTVRRLLQQARERLEARLLAPPEPPRVAPVAIDPADAPLRYEDYTLEQLVGAGGMGKVYRARHKPSGELVAFKALHKAWQHDRRAVERLVQEARLLTRLRHPHIVGVRGLGRFPGGSFFLVMDLVAGGDLARRLKEGPLSVTEACLVVSEVASAVGYAHQQGVLHCDLKPANVLLDASGRALVTDFGFAHLLAPRDGASQSIGGTAVYMPPELLAGAADPTPAGDIYALGVLLWELVTGQQAAQPLDFSAANERSELAQLIAIVRRCTERNPEKRFATAEEFSSVLEPLLVVSR